MERKINQDAWPRKEIFDFFSGVSNPFYMVTFRQDVTELYRYVKRHGLSFYYSLIYLCTEAINEVEAFRYGIRDGQVYELSGRMPSFTDLKTGSRQFHIVTMPCNGTLEEFSAAAREKSRRQQVFLDHTMETDQLIYYSCLPWMDMTAMTNERDLAAPEARDESIPHIAWGKYAARGDWLELGISIEVNHRLIDGIHLGEFAQALDRRIRGLATAD